ncbi:protein kinase [Streptomyces sp. NPDC059491]|uniref:caspase, EACC1-associated type n=1 Tax=Streptomyces sp. NPDC059491 TaxID=3346850 RepID=UPI00368F9C94
MSGTPDLLVGGLSRAVLVGTGRYTYLPDLPAVANNLWGLNALVTGTAHLGLPAENATVILDPQTPSEVLKPLRQAAAEATDTLIVYYAGHGLQDEDDLDLHLGLVHSHVDSPEDSLAYSAVRKAVLRTRARRRIVILDSCFSGLAMGAMSDPAQTLAGQAAIEGVYLMCSAAPTAAALAQPGEPYTAFTEQLIAVLSTGIEDGPEFVTLDGAFSDVRGRLAARKRPVPRRQVRESIGSLVLVRNVRHIPPSPYTGHVPGAGTDRGPGSGTAGRQSRDGSLVLASRYRMGALLGRGGMAEVREAHDDRLDRAVAVKLLRQDLARDEGFQARFRREARSTASLNHPSIVAVHDTGEEDIDGVLVPYIIMEKVNGKTLRHWLDASVRFPYRDVLLAGVSLLRALDYSHACGIVHRDVKPANIMVTLTGQIKVMDFGIAQMLADTQQQTGGVTATVIGTAQYLAPEAMSGDPVDGRADLYSTGCVLYEMLAGRPPFIGDSPIRVAEAHRREQPEPPSAHAPGIPAELDALLLRALNKSPDDRFSSGEEMAEALNEVVARRDQRTAWPDRTTEPPQSLC